MDAPVASDGLSRLEVIEMEDRRLAGGGGVNSPRPTSGRTPCTTHPPPPPAPASKSQLIVHFLRHDCPPACGEESRLRAGVPSGTLLDRVDSVVSQLIVHCDDASVSHDNGRRTANASCDSMIFDVV